MTNDDQMTRRRGISIPELKAIARTAAVDPDLLSARELAALEAASDPLIDLVGHHDRLRASSPAFDDPRFLEWLSNEARAGVGAAPEALSSKQIARLAQRVIARMQGERFAVPSAGDKYRSTHTGPSGRVSELVGEARGLSRSPVLGLSVAAGAGRELWDMETDAWVELPSDLPRGRYLALTISGDSMTPMLHPDDMVLLRLGEEVLPQSIIVARVPDYGYVVKAVKRVNPIFVELESLNRAYAPLRVPREELTVLGTVILRWYGAKGMAG